MSCDHRDWVEVAPSGVLIWCRNCGALRERGKEWTLPVVALEAMRRERLMHSGGMPALTSRMGPMSSSVRGYESPDDYERARQQRRLVEEVMRLTNHAVPQRMPADVPDTREALDAVKLADKVFK